MTYGLLILFNVIVNILNVSTYTTEKGSFSRNLLNTLSIIATVLQVIILKSLNNQLLNNLSVVWFLIMILPLLYFSTAKRTEYNYVSIPYAMVLVIMTSLAMIKAI